MIEKEVVTKEVIRPAKVLSRLDHPVVLSYGGEAFVLPPKGQVKVKNKDLLGALPNSVVVIPLSSL